MRLTAVWDPSGFVALTNWGRSVGEHLGDDVGAGDVGLFVSQRFPLAEVLLPFGMPLKPDVPQELVPVFGFFSETCGM